MPNVNGKQLLLVEDQAIMAMSQKVELEQHGYSVVTCATGEEAVALAPEDHAIDLVLMDIDLGSGMDGTQAARRILSKRDLPLVFLSSHTEQEIVQRTEGITSYGYVVKNSGITVLDAAIKMAFRLHDALNEARSANNELQQTYEELQMLSEELQSSLDDVLTRESKLQKSEERFRSMVEGAPVPIFIQTNGTFAYVNQPAVELFGARSPEELIGTSVLDPLHPDVRSVASHNMQLINGEMRPIRDADELRLITRDGREVWVEAVAEPIEYQDERGALVFVRDVTEQRDFQSKLEGWNQLLGYIISHANSAVAVLDRDLFFVYVSERFRSEYGLPRDEVVVGRHHYDVFPDIPEKWREIHQRALAGEVLSAEFDSFERADGTMDFTRWEVRPWHEHDGTIGGIVLYTEVVTEQMRQKLALEESEARFRLFVELVPSAVVISDEQERLVYASERFEALFGYPREVLDSVDAWWPRAYPDPALRKRVQSEWAEIMQTARRTGHPSGSVVSPVTRADGSVIQVEFRLASTGEFNAITYTDVTDRVESQERVRSLLEEKELLLREVHHRIKNNLNTMVSLLALQADASRERGNESAAIALEDAERRIQSVQMLYNALLQSDDRKSASIDSYLEPLVRETVGLSSATDRIEVTIDCEAVELPESVLAPIGIAVNELVTNAMKYALNGVNGGALHVGVHAVDDTLEVMVRDDGPGVRSEALNQPGLGLTIVEALAQQIGGQFTIRSEGGTVATITVPVEKSDVS